MKKFILALALLPISFTYCADKKNESSKDAPKAAVTTEKQDDDRMTKYLTNYKGIVTGSIALALGINTILRAKSALDEAFRQDNRQREEKFYGYFCNALINGFVAWQAFVCSQKTWKQIK